MKKMRKGLLVLSAAFLLFTTGCSCDNDNNTPPPTQQNYDEDKNYENYSKSLVGLYEENVKTTVSVIAQNKTRGGTSYGTGVVYKEDETFAYILTNAHVVYAKKDKDNQPLNLELTDLIEVVYSNHIREKANFIAYDRDEDVAVISVRKNSNYKVAKIVTDDSSTKIGEAVFAIGNPHKQNFSMSEGVISNTKRKEEIDYIGTTENETTFVYNSTATINEGNSGGPLFNSKGEVIAINTMYPVNTTKKEYRNFNYSIPARHFVEVADYIISKGNNTYKRAYLDLSGFSISDKTTEERAALTQVLSGVFVTNSNYLPISEEKTVIIGIGDVVVRTLEDLEYELFTKYGKATTVQLTIIDKNGIGETTVTVPLLKKW